MVTMSHLGWEYTVWNTCPRCPWVSSNECLQTVLAGEVSVTWTEAVIWKNWWDGLDRCLANPYPSPQHSSHQHILLFDSFMYLSSISLPFPRLPCASYICCSCGMTLLKYQCIVSSSVTLSLCLPCHLFWPESRTDLLAANSWQAGCCWIMDTSVGIMLVYWS